MVAASGSFDVLLDDDRTCFLVELNCHPNFINALNLNEFDSTGLTNQETDQAGGQAGGAIGGAIGGANLTGRQLEIVGLMKKNNVISYRKIAKVLNINDSAVFKHVRTLKRLGIIERIGGTRGFWVVKINGLFPDADSHDQYSAE